jgi:hypothetical protein
MVEENGGMVRIEKIREISYIRRANLAKKRSRESL